MAKGKEDPLFVSDIQYAEKSRPAIFRDILDAIDSFRERGANTPEELAKLAIAHAFTRQAAFTVLERLQAEGIGEAEELRDRLAMIDPKKQPYSSDMYAVANLYEEDCITAAGNTAEQSRLKKLQVLADATGSVAIAQFTCSISGSDSPQGKAALTGAYGLVNTLSFDMPLETHKTFKRVIDQIRMEFTQPS